MPDVLLSRAYGRPIHASSSTSTPVRQLVSIPAATSDATSSRALWVRPDAAPAR